MTRKSLLIALTLALGVLWLAAPGWAAEEKWTFSDYTHGWSKFEHNFPKRYYTSCKVTAQNTKPHREGGGFGYWAPTDVNASITSTESGHTHLHKPISMKLQHGQNKEETKLNHYLLKQVDFYYD